MNRKAKYEQKYIKKTIRFSPEEYQRIKKELTKNNENFTQFAKRAIIKKKTRLPSYLKAKQQVAYELNRIGNNLNQLAKLAHTYGDLNILQKLTSIEHQLRQIK